MGTRRGGAEGPAGPQGEAGAAATPQALSSAFDIPGGSFVTRDLQRTLTGLSSLDIFVGSSAHGYRSLRVPLSAIPILTGTPQTPVLYLSDNATDSLYSVNVATGAATLIGDLDTRKPFALGSLDGVLYLLSQSDDNLYSLNVETAAKTLIGDTGVGASGWTLWMACCTQSRTAPASCIRSTWRRARRP